MKSLFPLWLLISIGIIATGCKKDPSDPIEIKKEKTSVIISISTSQVDTRAEDNLAAEKAIDLAKGLKVYVFNENGILEYSSDNELNNHLSLTAGDIAGEYETSEFEVTVGNKYFFIFANDGSRISNTNTPMNSFMREIIDLTRDNEDLFDITEANSFLMGTLWKEPLVSVSGGGIPGAPITIRKEIGRLVSKINLKTVNTINSSEFNGAFESTGLEYRLGTIARKIYTVGIHEEGKPMPNEDNTVFVESTVHDVAGLTASDNPDSENFYRYTNEWKEIDEFFYATENTTAIDLDPGVQYFGNTTYIQLKSVYTPDAGEIYNPQTLANEALGGNGTFWLGQVIAEPTTLTGAAGKRILLNANPAMGKHTDIEQWDSYPEYTGGVNYHKFVIFDPGNSSSGDVIKNRVLRNHFYEFEVSEFLDLGDPSEDVDPEEPVPSKTTVKINVTVKDWDKVTGTTPVG